MADETETPKDQGAPEAPHQEQLPLPEYPKTDPEFVAAATKWINAKWISEQKACPICAVVAWTVAERAGGIQVTRQMGATGPPIANIVYPVILIICSNCGYTMVFNAVMAGLWPPSVPTSADVPPQEQEPQ